MQLTNILDDIVVDEIENLKINEIKSLIKEYDSLDQILIENKSYDRDVQIVVRLDELGAFDEVLNEARTKRGSRSPEAQARRAERAALQASRLNPNKTPDAVAPGVSVEPAQAEPDVPVPSAEPSAAPQDAQAKADSERRAQKQAELEKTFSRGSMFKFKVGQLARMLGSAVKSGKDKLVAKIKAAINKVRGRKPDAPVSDVPGVPKDVAAKVDATPAQTSAEPEGEPDLFGGTSTPEPTQGDTTEPEAPTSAPSDPDQTNLDFDTPAEEPTAEPAAPEAPAPEEPTAEPTTDNPEVPSPEEPKDTFDPKERDRLQTLAGIKPEEPAAEPVAPEAPTPKEPAVEPVASPPVTPAAEKPAEPKTSKQNAPATEKPEAPSADISSTETKPKSEPPKVEPSKSSADVPTSDEPKRLIPKAQPTPEPDEPKRLIPKGAPTAAKPKEPEKPSEPEKPVQPWSAQGRERRAKELAAMSPEDRQREREKSARRMGLEPTGSKFSDRLRAGWRAFRAAPGTSVQAAPTQYRSIFNEVLEMLEELQEIERQLEESTISEALVGGQKKLDANRDGRLTAKDFAMLRARRKALREALVKEMVREELFNHNTTLEEINANQRTALIKHVHERSKRLWELMAQMRVDEQNTEKDIEMLQKEQIQPVGESTMERYTLEEWMGMLEEAGYDTSEVYSLWRPKESGAKSSGVVKDPKKPKTPSTEPKRFGQHRRKDYPHMHNPDGTKKTNPELSPEKRAAALANPRVKLRNTSEQYTLEEWMGMVKEAWGTSPTPYTDSVPRGRMVKGADGQANWQDYSDAEKGALRQQQAANIRTQYSAAKAAANTTPAPGNASKIWAGKQGMRDAEAGAKDAGVRLSQTPLPAGAKPTGTFKPTTTSTQGAPVPPAQKPKAGQPGGLPLPPKRPQMAAESYTLEEWTNALQEAGFDLEEGFMDTLRRGATSVGRAVSTGLEKVGLKKPEAQKAAERKAQEDADKAWVERVRARTAARDKAAADAAQRRAAAVSGINAIAAQTTARAAQDAEASRQRAAERAAERERRQAAKQTPQGKAPQAPQMEESHTLNENTISRLQQLAGINPTE